MNLQKPEHRLTIGTIGFTVALVIAFLSGFSFYNPNETLVSTLIVTSGGLLSAGLVKHFKKEQ